MQWNKFVFALVMAVVLGLRQGLTDHVFGPVDWVITAGMVFNAVATWRFPNLPRFETAKTWASAFVLGAGVLVPLLADGWQLADLWPVVIAVATGAGVWVIPNAGTIDGVFPHHRIPLARTA